MNFLYYLTLRALQKYTRENVQECLLDNTRHQTIVGSLSKLSGCISETNITRCTHNTTTLFFFFWMKYLSHFICYVFSRSS